MSYFRGIIDRTLSHSQRSIKPALTPDSLPETPVETKGAAASRARKYMPTEGKDAKGLLASAPPAAGDVAKGDLPKDDAKAIESHDEPQKQRESRVEVLQSSEPQRSRHSADKAGDDDPSDFYITKKPERPVRSQEEDEESIADVVKGTPMKESGNKSGPSIETRAHETLQVPAPWKHDASSSITDSKTGNDHDQQKYPSVEPTECDRAKYPEAYVSPPEETVVTINIGRIEVRAQLPTEEPPKHQRNKFSPALSLADYLKQRSEGRIG